jgi:glycosyltransferase involved in cell wall biosynthesis
LSSTPLVSIIIPLYNAEKYIAEAITSAKTQTWPNIEIIVIDDGSTDNSLAVAKTFEGENIKIFNQENRGASAARNKGLSESKGEYIQFLDADDFISPGKIKEQVKLLPDGSNYLSAGPIVHFIDGEDPYMEAPVLDWFKEGIDDTADFLVKQYGGSLIGLDYGGMVALHSWLIPKRLIDQAGLWNEELSLDDDGEFMCRVVLAAKGIKYAPNAINYYRKHANDTNISSSISYRAHLSLLTSVKLRTKYLLARRDDKYSRMALSRIFDEIAVSFYPEFPELTTEAEKIARELDPNRNHFPYNSFPSKYISNIFGWKIMKRLTRMKQQWTSKKV